MADTRTSDERYRVDPFDYSEDPGYGYHSLGWHAARIADDEKKLARKAARDNARARGRSVREAVAA